MGLAKVWCAGCCAGEKDVGFRWFFGSWLATVFAIIFSTVDYKDFWW